MKPEEKIKKLETKYLNEVQHYRTIIYDNYLLDKIIQDLRKKYLKKIMKLEKKIKDVN